MTELRHCLRRLRQAPLFTSVAVLTLAIGIGANTMVLSWVETVLWNAIPGAEEPRRLVTVVQKHGGHVNGTMSYKNIRDFTENAQDLFSAVTATDMAAVNVRVGEAFEWAWAQTVLTSYFEVMHVAPALGTLDFPGEDEASGSSPYVVISHRYWQRRFNGNPNLIGKEIEINGQAMTVRGVTSKPFRGSVGGLTFDVWVPLAMQKQLGISSDISTQSRGNSTYDCLARLKPSVSAKTIQPRLAALGQQFGKDFDHVPADMEFGTVPMWKAPNGGQEVLLPLLRVLVIIGGVVLLIVVANVSGLVLARATVRQREMSIRLAMGAARWQVMKQVLLECVVLALAGGALAVLVSRFGVSQFARFLPQSTLPTGYDFNLSWGILGLSLFIAFATGLLFGLLPAWQVSRTSMNQVINETGRGTEGRSRKLWLRRALVSMQVAFAFVLVACAALCLQSVSRSHQVDLGFDPEKLWVASFHLEGLSLSDQEKAAYYKRLEEKLGSLAGVESVGLASDLPLGFDGFSGSSFSLPGVDDSEENQYRWFSYVMPVNDAYFKAMRIPILAGRVFDGRDQQDSVPTVVINQALAKRHFDDVDPLGKTIEIWGRQATIVGVVASGKYRALNERLSNFVYFPQSQMLRDNRIAILRTAENPHIIATAVERAALEINPEVNVLHAMTMKDSIQPAFLLQNIASTFLTGLGIVALLLAALGIYGITAFNVNRRLREIGIRLALGALPGTIRSQILKQGVKLAGAGLLVGVALSIGVTGLLSSFLIGVQPRDPVVFTSVAAMLLGMALLACYFPARRATRVEPVEALRCD